MASNQSNFHQIETAFKKLKEQHTHIVKSNSHLKKENARLQDTFSHLFSLMKKFTKNNRSVTTEPTTIATKSTVTTIITEPPIVNTNTNESSTDTIITEPPTTVTTTALEESTTTTTVTTTALEESTTSTTTTITTTALEESTTPTTVTTTALDESTTPTTVTTTALEESTTPTVVTDEPLITMLEPLSTVTTTEPISSENPIDKTQKRNIKKIVLKDLPLATKSQIKSSQPIKQIHDHDRDRESDRKRTHRGSYKHEIKHDDSDDDDDNDNELTYKRQPQYHSPQQQLPFIFVSPPFQQFALPAQQVVLQQIQQHQQMQQKHINTNAFIVPCQKCNSENAFNPSICNSASTGIDTPLSCQHCAYNPIGYIRNCNELGCPRKFIVNIAYNTHIHTKCPPHRRK